MMSDQREERFKQMIREIVRLFDESGRDAGAVLRIELPQWKVCGALGIKGDSPDWCRIFAADSLDREPPEPLAHRWFEDYQAEYKDAQR